uniref:C2H2-type domain-containing protein n=1 Tax=Glossina austeni TaxID=7395 RepID=A0A1A9ULL2_GLOAU
MENCEELESSEMLLQKCGEIFYDTLTASNVNVSFQCTFCRKTFTKLDAFLEHFQSEHYKPSIPTEKFFFESDEEEEQVEDFMFATKQNVSQYISDKNEDSASSLECTLESAEREMASDHESNIPVPDEKEKSVVNLKPYKCDQCSIRFVSKSNLNAHLKRHKDEKPPCKRGPYICPRCDKVVKSPGLLSQHLYKHDGVKPYKCQQCQATFTWKSNLKTHQKRHKTERRYDCRFCSKSFYFTTERRRHERRHTGDRPFVCESCGKSFSSSSGLRSHRSSQHLKERNFICDKCNRCFNRASQLRLHQINIHTEKPLAHVCTICKEAFKGKMLLRIHAKIHKTIKCLECDKTFARYSGLYAHRKRHEKQKNRLLANKVKQEDLTEKESDE